MCIINIPTAGRDFDKLYDLGLSEAKARGGQLTGNKRNGYFSVAALGGQFEGTYSVTETFVEIKLNKKPLFITCGLIKTFLYNLTT